MKKFLAILLLTATVAFAAVQLDQGPTNRIQNIRGGLLVSPDTFIQTTALVNTHRITRSLVGSATIDFAGQTTTCNTSNITVTGARVNDACMVGLSATAGAANSSFTCYVAAANTVTVKHCASGTVSDPASQVYTVRVFSNL